MAIAAAIIGGGAATAGAVYNVAQGVKQAKNAKKAEKAASAATSALDSMSAEQWNNYQENFQPVVQKYIGTVNQGIPAGEAVGAASAGVMQQQSTIAPQAARGMMASGINVNSPRFRNAQNILTTQSALTDAGSQADAARAVNMQNFNNRLAMVQTGRGIPGAVMQGQAALANRYQNEADKYGEAAGDSFKSAMGFIGLGR